MKCELSATKKHLIKFVRIVYALSVSSKAFLFILRLKILNGEDTKFYGLILVFGEKRKIKKYMSDKNNTRLCICKDVLINIIKSNPLEAIYFSTS